MPRERYYVVFAGREPGIYRDWASCLAQVDGFSGAQHRSFGSVAEAERAWMEAGGDPMPLDDEPSPSAPARGLVGVAGGPAGVLAGVLAERGPPPGSIAVDAACSGNPGPMEYRGVEIDTGTELFAVGPMEGTNNIGEFLAIVHGLAWLEAERRPGPLYTDSMTAIGWVTRARARTTLARNASTEQAWQLLARAQRWLRQGRVHGIEIRKWPTRRWGEIPADFGRK